MELMGIAFVLTVVILAPGWSWSGLLAHGFSEMDFTRRIALGLGVGFALVSTSLLFLNAAFALPLTFWTVVAVVVALTALPYLLRLAPREPRPNSPLGRLLGLWRWLER